MPSYTWSCLACGTRNESIADTCFACGCPSEATFAQIQSHRIAHVSAVGDVSSAITNIQALNGPMENDALRAKETHPDQAFPEMEARRILRDLEKRTTAKKVLANSAKRPTWPETLFLVFSLGSAQYMLKDMHLSHWAIGLFVGMLATIIWLSTQLRRIDQRLEATIQLLNLAHDDRA